jgi:hypothetical protein
MCANPLVLMMIARQKSHTGCDDDVRDEMMM